MSEAGDLGNRRRIRAALSCLRRHWAVALISAGLGLAFLLLVGETLARRYLSDCWGYMQTDPKLGWSYRPGARSNALIVWGWGRLHKQKIEINSHGLRDREIDYPKPPGVFRFLCLGDSILEAAQLPLEDSLTKRFEAMLNSRGGPQVYEVINAGRGNYGTDQECLFYKEEGRKYKADVVALFVFPCNDFSDNVPELNDRAYFEKPFFSFNDGRLAWPEKLLLAGPMQELRRQNTLIRFDSRLCLGHMGGLYLRSYLKPLAQAMEYAHILPKQGKETPEGCPLALGVFHVPPGPEWLKAVDLTAAIVDALRQEVEKDGAGFRIVILPFMQPLAASYPDKVRWPAGVSEAEMDRGQPERLARESLSQVPAPTLDLTDVFLKAIRETGRPTNLWPDGHFNAFGHELAAKALLEFCEELGDVKAQP